MASREAQFAAFARQIARRDKSSSYAPETAQLSLHMGTIADVDLTTGTVSWAFNGSDVVQGGIRFLQAYTDTNPPQAGDTAWSHYNGTSLLVLGRHSVPNSTVVL